MGILEVRGQITLNQFWPTGGADADTVKIKLILDGQDAFRFTPEGGQPRVTHAFDGARVRGKGGGNAIQVKDGQEFITVRLRGVDAPELHYTPSAEVKKADQTAAQREAFYMTQDLLEDRFSAPAHVLSDFVAPTSLSVQVWPEDLVFIESGSSLTDGNGNRITSWW